MRSNPAERLERDESLNHFNRADNNNNNAKRSAIQRPHLLSAAIAAALVGGLPAGAGAQVLEEVVVTAQKREQGLQDVGVSVTAFSGEQMEALGWDNSLDVAAQTPGLITTSNTGDSANIALFSIRGVSQLDFAEGQEAPVALYRDEAYVSSPGASGTPAFDIERIEVLRGPQGTLYGRNATGGLVHFISNKPTLEPEGSVGITMGEYGQVGFTGVMSGPLSDSVQGRLAIYSNQDDGYVNNTMGPNKRADDTQSVRGMLNFGGGGGSSLLLIGQYTDIDTRGGVFHSVASKDPGNGRSVFCANGDTDCGTFTADQDVGTNNFFGNGALFDAANNRLDDGIGDELEGAYDRADSGVDREAWNYTGIFKTQFANGANFVSVTDYTVSEKVYREDDDSTEHAVVIYDATADVKQFSQELRLSGSNERRDWITGIYFLDIENDFSGAFAFPSDVYFPRFIADSETQTISLFGQVDWRLSERWLLTAGLRYISDDKDLTYQLMGENATDPSADQLLNGESHPFSREDDEWSGKLQLDWQATENSLWYLGVSRGVKGGGFNTPADGADEATIEAVGFEPEILLAYELGMKNEWADGRARLNGSVYYYDYEDFQAFFFADTTSSLVNSEAEFVGAELELILSPGRGWDLLLGISTIDTTVDGANPGCFDDNENTNCTMLDDERAPLAADWSVNGLIRKRWDFAGGGGFSAQLSGSYVGEQYFNVVNADVTRGGEYTLWDTKLAFHGPDDRWEASLFVHNITDERALTYSYDISGFGNYTIQVFGPPRWLGGNVTYRF